MAARPWQALERTLRRLGPADRLARTAVTLGLIGASLVLLFQVLFLKRADDFLIKNQLGNVRGRTIFILTIAAGAVLPNLIALAYVAWRREPGLERVHRLATRLVPLTLAFMLPALFSWPIGHWHTLFYLTVLGLFGLGLQRLLPRSFYSLATEGHGRFVSRLRRLRLTPTTCTIAVAVAAAAFAIYFSYHTILMHRLIGTTAFDLGIYDNLMYNAMKGRPFSSPVLFGPGDRSYIAGHAEFAMLLFVPFYAIKPGPETMLVLQSVLLGGAAIPLYLFARTRIPAPAAAVVSIAYLLFGPLQLPMFYDFHWLPVVIFFLFWVFYGVATGRHWITACSVVVVWLIREDTAVGVAFLGLFMILTGWRPAVGFVLAALSSVWFVIVRFIIMPLAGTWFFPQLYNGLFADGQQSFGSVIRTLITNPLYVLGSLLTVPKVIYVLHMLGSLAWLPVRKPIFVLLLVPGSIFTILTTDAAPMTAVSFQYTSHVIPYVFLATVLALGTLTPDPAVPPAVPAGVAPVPPAVTPAPPSTDLSVQAAEPIVPPPPAVSQTTYVRLTAALVAMMCTVLSHSYNWGAMLQRERVIGGWRQVTFTMSPEAKVRYQALRQLVDKIPREASVAATEFMSPHVSTRVTSYVLRYDVDDVDYVLLSSREINDDYRRLLTTLFTRTAYGLAGHTGNEFYLFQKGVKSPQTGEAFVRLGLSIPVK